MSYDVEVFSIEKPISPASEEGRGWQIAVDGPLNVEPEDIIQPFYAEIRTGECPTKCWWWNGIPTASPAAC